MIKRVLVVEDDPSAQLVLKRLLLRFNPFLHVQCVATAETANRILVDAKADERTYDLVIADLELPGSNGLVLWDLARRRDPSLEFLFVSGTSYPEWLERVADRSETPAFLPKPLSEESLRCYLEKRLSIKNTSYY